MPTLTVTDAARVRPLRTRVLRPEWPAGRLLVFDEDEHAVHVAAEEDGAVVGVATLYLQAPPVPLGPGEAWQLRGMATAPDVQGTGVGAAVLAAGLDEAARRGACLAWCNARAEAVGFYDRAGWTTVGEPFEIAGVGPHVVMWRTLRGGGERAAS